MTRSPSSLRSRFFAETPSMLVPHEQPLSQRAAVAVGLAPVLVLLALTLVIGDVLPIDIGFGVVAASITWLVFEMHQYQRAVARLDDDSEPEPAADLPDLPDMPVGNL